MALRRPRVRISLGPLRTAERLFCFKPSSVSGEAKVQPKAGSVSKANGGEGNLSEREIEKVRSLQEAAHSSNLSGSIKKSPKRAFSF